MLGQRWGKPESSCEDLSIHSGHAIKESNYLSSGSGSALEVWDLEPVLASIERERKEEAARPPLVVHHDTNGTFVAGVTAFVSISH